MMEFFTNAADFIVAHKETLGLIFTILVVLAQAIKAKLQTREAILLLINTLKDEDKLTPSGEFKKATIEKLEKVAQVANAGQTAVTEVKKTIEDVNRGGMKIGSFQGKPVYLEDVGKIGSQLGAALSILRGILKK